MRPRRRRYRGFCAALSIQHSLFLLLPRLFLLYPTILLYLFLLHTHARTHSLSLFFFALLSHSFYVSNSIFFPLSFVFSFHVYFFISLSFSLCHLFVSIIALHSSLPLIHLSFFPFSYSLLLSPFIFVALILLPNSNSANCLCRMIDFNIRVF